MIDFSQVLREKQDAIVQQWVDAVLEDSFIEATQELTRKAVQDSLPRVLEAMATVLSKSQTSDVETLVDASLEHGVIRAEQGFEPAEIAREYRILRTVVFSLLEPDLLQATSAETLRAVRLIDTVIDEAIARCFNSYTEGRLRELGELQKQLILTNQELTRLVRASKDNMSHLAHELKAPLTSIIGYSDLFLRQQRQSQAEVRDSATNLEHIERVLRGGRRLLQLINDTLEISRYDAGKMTAQGTLTNVSSLIEAVMEVVEPLAQEKRLTLETDLSQAPTEVLIDPLRLQQILTNLLSNAIRYTRSGSIKLTCWGLSNAPKWAIAVSDTGIGMSGEQQSHIFDPYFRAEEVTTTEGTGLGLAIVDRLVRLLDGEIRVESVVGMGSTFTVILPTNLPDNL